MDFISRELALLAGPSGGQLVAWRAPFGIAVTVLFAMAARLMRSVTVGGAIAGAVLTFAIWLAWPPAFLALFTVFALTSGATRLGYARKQRASIAEHREGRSARQVLANIVIAATAAVIAEYAHQVIAFAAFAAALAEAACDTVSSEIGQAFSSRAWMITSFQRVEAGIDGGISAIGTLAGLLAAIAVAAVAAAVTVISWSWVPAVVLAAFCGMLFDSLLGATLEHRFLNNNAVNLLGTAFAAGFALLFV